MQVSLFIPKINEQTHPHKKLSVKTVWYDRCWEERGKKKKHRTNQINFSSLNFTQRKGGTGFTVDERGGRFWAPQGEGSSDLCPSPASPEHQPHQQLGQANMSHRSDNSIMAFWKGLVSRGQQRDLKTLGGKELGQ